MRELQFNEFQNTSGGMVIALVHSFGVIKNNVCSLFYPIFGLEYTPIHPMTGLPLDGSIPKPVNHDDYYKNFDPNKSFYF